jgi:hypothetical protein
VLAAAVAGALVVLVAAGWLAAHHRGSSAQAQSLTEAHKGAGASAGQAQPGGGKHGAGSKTTGPVAVAGAAGSTSPVAGAGQPGGTTAAGLPASATPSPAPSPSTGSAGSSPPPPAGYKWYQISAAGAGATAGFKIAIPVGWNASADGLQTYFDPPVGSAYIEANLARFAYQNPVREAGYLQAQAKADHTYRLYGLVAITPATFRGAPEASWRFHWQEAGAARTAVLQVLFTLTTPAGSQSYALTESAPAASFPAVVFGEALLTFKPLP